MKLDKIRGNKQSNYFQWRAEEERWLASQYGQETGWSKRENVGSSDADAEVTSCSQLNYLILIETKQFYLWLFRGIK